MTTYAKIRTNAVVFNPVSTDTTPNTLFANNSGTLSSTDGSGGTAPITRSADAAYGIKLMQAHETIRVGKTVSKRSDGTIVEAESDVAGRQQPVGIALVAFASAGDQGNVLLFAPNAPGVLTGLGFTPGDDIYVGETTGGYVNDITPFTGNDDSLIKVGVADCAAGAASGVVTDLIMITLVIARP
jgi:hypothetical protein